MTDSDKMTIRQFSTNLASTIEAVVKRSCIIDFGVIKEIPAEGIVTVAVSVVRDREDVRIMDCTYADIASSAMTLYVKPEVGDKVLVVYPRRFSEEMFDVTKDDFINDKYANGYNLTSGIAIPLNQYRKNQHNNVMEFSEGEMHAKLAYDQESKENKVQLDIESDGSVSVKSNDTLITIADNGAMQITGKAEISVDENGNVTVNAKSGKLELKNSSASLYTVLNGMLNILNTSLQTQGSPASHTVIPSQFQTQVTQLGQLMK